MIDETILINIMKLRIKEGKTREEIVPDPILGRHITSIKDFNRLYKIACRTDGKKNDYYRETKFETSLNIRMPIELKQKLKDYKIRKGYSSQFTLSKIGRDIIEDFLNKDEGFT